MSRIFLSAPDLRGRELEYVMAAVDSGWLAPAGPDLEAFEHEIGRWAGGRHAVGLSSGTAALHLALLSVGVVPGDEVLCSTLTFVASANAIVQAGATPVFVDSEASDWNVDPELLAEILRHRAERGRLPAALMVVDLLGQCCDYRRIERVCAEYDVPIVEDAAEALGATFHGEQAGSFGDVAAFSFNGNKIVTASGGGMLLTADPQVAERVRYLSTQARQPSAHYEHTEVGYNYRLSNILAALGRAQLADLPERIERRREINRAYRDALASIPGIDFMPEAEGRYSTFWLTCITIDPKIGTDREQVRLQLEAHDIECRPLWKPMHRQPMFASHEAFTTGVSDRLFDRGLCLPSGSGMTDTQLDFVLERLTSTLHGR